MMMLRALSQLTHSEALQTKSPWGIANDQFPLEARRMFYDCFPRHNCIVIGQVIIKDAYFHGSVVF